MPFRFVVALTILACSRPVFAQQRPLITEDPEPIGAGRMLIEGGIDFAHDQRYPTSGLRGNPWRLPAIGLSFGLSTIAELQIDGGLRDRLAITGRYPTAPLASLVTATGNSTTSFEDVIVGTKIRLISEAAGRPAFGLRFATKLPNASNESGLGTDSMDFYASVLAAKTVQSLRVVANLGAAILSDPTVGNRQNDVLTYGVSFARALSQRSELVGELNGRRAAHSRGAGATVSSRAAVRAGQRYRALRSARCDRL